MSGIYIILSLKLQVHIKKHFNHKGLLSPAGKTNFWQEFDGLMERFNIFHCVSEGHNVKHLKLNIMLNIMLNI